MDRLSRLVEMRFARGSLGPMSQVEYERLTLLEERLLGRPRRCVTDRPWLLEKGPAWLPRPPS